MIDLRTDAVTLPTNEMLESIMQAGARNCGMGNDPTVDELQELAARIFGAEDALLLTGSIQCGMVALMTHCRPGDGVLIESQAHPRRWADNWTSSMARVILRSIEGYGGIITGDQVRLAADWLATRSPPPRLLIVENSHDRAGGTCWSPGQVSEAAEAARELGMKVHLDGTRIFNAAVALGVPVSDYMRHVDSLQFSLSRGLSCPAGSLLVGPCDIIKAAREFRDLLGGGMRQAGMIAAPGLVALRTMVPRLAEDHANARRLVNDLEVLDEVVIDRRSVQTNIVKADISATGMTPEMFEAKAKGEGLLISSWGENHIRFVMHRGITADDVDRAAMIVESIIPSCPSGVCSI